MLLQVRQAAIVGSMSQGGGAGHADVSGSDKSGPVTGGVEWVNLNLDGPISCFRRGADTCHNAVEKKTCLFAMICSLLVEERGGRAGARCPARCCVVPPFPCEAYVCVPLAFARKTVVVRRFSDRLARRREWAPNVGLQLEAGDLWLLVGQKRFAGPGAALGPFGGRAASSAGIWNASQSRRKPVFIS